MRPASRGGGRPVIPWRAPSGDGITQRGNGSDERDVPPVQGSRAQQRLPPDAGPRDHDPARVKPGVGLPEEHDHGTRTHGALGGRHGWRTGAAPSTDSDWWPARWRTLRPASRGGGRPAIPWRVPSDKGITPRGDGMADPAFPPITDHGPTGPAPDRRYRLGPRRRVRPDVGLPEEHDHGTRQDGPLGGRHGWELVRRPPPVVIGGRPGGEP
jgi:hypothetical protein